MQAESPAGGRLGWPDVLRALAMYGVFLAHLGALSAKISVFCFGFVMQLFFFVCGLFAARYAAIGFLPLLKRLARHLLLPYAVLAGMNLLYAAIKQVPNLGLCALQCLLAIRNRIFIPGLWFIPCLIVTTLAYWGLTRLLRKPIARLAVCLAISLAFRLFKETSEWFWSADSAMLFFFYYALGDVSMPVLRRVTFRGLSAPRKAGFFCASALCLAVTGFSYFLYNAGEAKPFGLVFSDTGLRLFTFAASTATVFLCVIAARLLQNVRILQVIGQNTLAISGTQTITSDFCFQLLWLIGVIWTVRSDWQTLVYGAAQLLFSCYVVAVPLKRLLPFVFGGRSAGKEKAAVERESDTAPASARQ